MARYHALQGVRYQTGNSNAEEDLKHSPFVVIVGPSGQFCQLLGPSGHGKSPYTYNLQAYANSFNHRSIAWHRNELITYFRGDYASLEGYGYAWTPYEQTENYKLNDTNYSPYNNSKLSDRVMLDGFNWKAFSHDNIGTRSVMGLLNIGGKVFWMEDIDSTAKLWNYGFYDGDSPTYKEIGSISGYNPKPGQYNTPGTLSKPNFCPGGTNAPGNITWLGGTRYSASTTVSSAVCDIAYHNGTIYIAGQECLMAMIPGGKGNYIYNDLSDDTTAIQSLLETAGYTARAVQGNYTTTSKCFVEHNNNLFMLSAEGKFYKVTPQRIIEQADLTLIGTQWASGITYGTCPRVGNNQTWGGTNGRRCYIASFNGELNAFLNFTSLHNKGAGAGNGLFWATSHDGFVWSDRTDKLPSSGIHSPSGSTSSELPGWRVEISPYKFSGATGSNAYANRTIWEHLASGDQFDYPSIWGRPCQPSGFRQHGAIPFWRGSGTMIDTAGTAYGSLNVPLQYGALSGSLFPTWKVLPEGFQTLNAASGSLSSFEPYGVGASGWDYTNCDNYHISGNVDYDEQVLRLIFSQDFHGGLGVGDRSRALYYELTKSSGWIQKNYLPHSNQFNGFVPIDLFDPEVIIPSGTLYNPNPRVDEVARTVSIDYSIHDWPYWSNVKVTGEYTTGTHGWTTFSKQYDVSTGTSITDPSGIIGASHTMTWNYGPKLGKNTEFHNIRIRLRAETI